MLHRRDDHIPTSARRHTSRCLGEIDVDPAARDPGDDADKDGLRPGRAATPWRTRRDLNNLMARGLVTLPLLEAALERLARRGRSGIVVMRRLIEEAEAKRAPADSNLELLVEEILETAGFRVVERQLPIYDDDGFIARVDFGDRCRRLAIEVDSDRFHGGLVDRKLDVGKPARLKGPDGSCASRNRRSGGAGRTGDPSREVFRATTPLLDAAPDPTPARPVLVEVPRIGAGETSTRTGEGAGSGGGGSQPAGAGRGMSR